MAMTLAMAMARFFNNKGVTDFAPLLFSTWSGTMLLTKRQFCILDWMYLNEWATYYSTTRKAHIIEVGGDNSGLCFELFKTSPEGNKLYAIVPE